MMNLKLQKPKKTKDASLRKAHKDRVEDRAK